MDELILDKDETRLAVHSETRKKWSRILLHCFNQNGDCGAIFWSGDLQLMIELLSLVAAELQR